MRITKRRLYPTLLATASLGLVLSFQNCSNKMMGFEPEEANKQEFFSTSSLAINNGAEYTNIVGVKVQVRAPLASKMYLTNDSSCESGGEWEDVRAERPWLLAQLNSKARVYAKFTAKNGAALPCIEASITHDDTAPTAEFIEHPPAFTKLAEARHDFRGIDSLSGADEFECKTNTGTWAKCKGPYLSSGLTEGAQRVQVRAIDRAGNVSNPIEHGWVIDQTPPNVRLTATPPARTGKSSATFRFEADDATAGVELVYCRLDTGSMQGTTNPGCTSPVSINNLGSANTDVTYTFKLWAKDKAGNVAEIAPYTFVVDQAPSGAFDVIGISSTGESKIDEYLGVVPVPRVHWTASNSAESYRVSILNASGSAVVCPEVTVAAPTTMHLFQGASCTLADGASYKAKVVAEDDVGNLREAPLYSFKVDITGPQINVTGPVLTNDDKDAQFSFSINDPSGIDSAVCEKTSLGTKTSQNCKTLTTVKYMDQAIGEHKFEIAATDIAGNSARSTPISWRVNQIVCDPFGSGSGADQCKKGLKANLWYLTGDQKLNPPKAVDRYISEGTLANVVIYLSQIFTPTMPFTAGFKTQDGSILRDNSGQILQEYFALNLESLLKLEAGVDSAGKYQIAIISDDGSKVEYKDSANGPWKPLIDNDGDHSTQMKCNLQGLDFTNTSRIPVRIRYYQGPRQHIAFTLIWRKMPTDPAKVEEATCGKVGSELFWGNTDNKEPDMVNYEYGKLVERGWKALKPANFILDEQK